MPQATKYSKSRKIAIYGSVYFGIKKINTLSGLTYKNIGKMARQNVFNVPNHLNLICQGKPV